MIKNTFGKGKIRKERVFMRREDELIRRLNKQKTKRSALQKTKGRRADRLELEEPRLNRSKLGYDFEEKSYLNRLQNQARTEDRVRRPIQRIQRSDITAEGSARKAQQTNRYYERERTTRPVFSDAPEKRQQSRSLEGQEHALQRERRRVQQPSYQQPLQQSSTERAAYYSRKPEAAITSKIVFRSDYRQKTQYRAQQTDAEKPLTYRHELKYYLNYKDYMLLRARLRAIMAQDEHTDEHGEYAIRSLYFDDLKNSAVQEKQAGVQYRRKYRIRIYNCKKDFIRFEKKIKNGEYIAKESFPMTYQEYLELIDGNYSFLLDKPQKLAKEVYVELISNLLRPRVVVDYDREAFVMNYQNIRITFDKNLRTGPAGWDFFDPKMPLMPMFDVGMVVLEVKFQKALPEYIQKILANVTAMQRSAVSKYIICRQYD